MKNITISSASLKALHTSVERINRIAKRLDVAGRVSVVSVSAPHEVTRFTTLTDEDGLAGETRTLHEVVDVVLDLPEVGVSTAGRYSLGAVVEQTDEGLDVRVVSERARPVATAIKSSSFCCVHCKAIRTRNKILVVLDSATAGNVLLLGTECAKNYLGTIDRDLDLLAFQNACSIFIGDLDRDLESSGGRRIRAWSADIAFAQAAASIRRNGYVPRWTKDIDGGRPTENANNTRNSVRFVLTSVNPEETAGQLPTDADKALAATVQAWLLAQRPESLHEALRGAYDAAQIELVSEKKLGVVCWAIEAHARELVEAARLARLASLPQGVAPSGRVQVAGEIVSIKEYEGFGYNSAPVVKALVLVTSPAAHARTKVFVTLGAWHTGIAAKGEAVEFVATFEASPSDPLFAKGTRPVAPKPAKAPKKAKA